MKLRWRTILPLLGLLAFGIESYHSLAMNRRLGATAGKYYYWSSIRLDKDPLNKNPRTSSPCNGAIRLNSPSESDSAPGGCAWETQYIWVHPSYFAEAFMAAALPAFGLSALTVRGLSRLGINEVWSFLVSMPVYVLGWFYLLGRVIDRWSSKHKMQALGQRPRKISG